MPDDSRKRPTPHRFEVSRRAFLKASGALTSATFFGCTESMRRPETVPEIHSTVRKYVLRRDADELFLELTTVGFREVRLLGFRWLQPIHGIEHPLLIFNFPPQHFAETTIPTAKIPAFVEEAQIATISLLPSRDSQIIFRVPKQERICLDVRDLLDWSAFDLVLPNLDDPALAYVLDVPRDENNPTTRIELPWGIELTPLGMDGACWQHPLTPNRSGEWIELWSTALRGPFSDEPRPFEVFSVYGFVKTSESGSVAENTKSISYENAPGALFPKPPTPLDNLDRIEIAASLSRRFPYTGQPGEQVVDSAVLHYDNTCVSACYATGRTVPVNDFRLSPRGGSLDLNAKWKPFPGCALNGWTHSATLGRDHHVKLIRAGFLYPFGVEAELVTISERGFVRDRGGHFVAVLFKQAFIQVPQPNRVDIDHAETIFRSVSVTTLRTPPLDLPSGGDPGVYGHYDFFLPMVDGKPFEFEHAGWDWAGEKHTSRMPMFFVSNKVRAANGLILEPNSSWTYKQRPPECRAAPVIPSDHDEHEIPRSGDGLRVVDKEWHRHPYRFAKYGEALIALAQPISSGDTSQRIEWVEWVRGIVHVPPPGQVAPRPFQPRTRTAKIRMQGISQFSGERQLALGTYRDTRFTGLPLLDPEPTATDDVYFANLAPQSSDISAPYFFLLETRDLISGPAAPAPLTAQQQREKIRQLYYAIQKQADIPDSLFDAIDNEVRFGRSASSDSTGGLAVPDTHVSTLTRRVGPLGDATFNPGRWEGFAKKKQSLQTAQRLDYAAFRLAQGRLLDTEPFDKAKSQADLQALAAAAVAVMGFTTPAVVSHAAVAVQTTSTPQLNLGDLFGGNAQVLPGIRFADLFDDIPVIDSAGGSTLANTDRAAEPLKWNFRVTGIDWLLDLIGSGPGQISMQQLIGIAQNHGQSFETSRPLPFGLEASLDWSNTSFNDKPLGPLVFKKTDTTEMRIAARASMDLGLQGLPENLADLKIDPSQARLTSRASLQNFSLLIFSAIEIVFNDVSFTMASDGRKEFKTDIKDVVLQGPLAFVNQLSKLLGGLGNGLGIDIDVSPARIKIGQTIRVPAAGDQPLFVGPAQIINLAFSWGLMIPLIGRDVLTVSFALASREKPMLIYVPPWYGGKAHILMELTTRGVKLLEFSMEYGALIPVRWGIASGEASLTAGIFYSVERVVNAQQQLTGGRVILRAFVKAAANVDVAGIIHFGGLISISLSQEDGSDGKRIIGESRVEVSIKIGFVRISYSFSATHVDERRNASAELLSLPAMSSSAPDTMDCASTIPQANTGDRFLFGPDFNQDAFKRIVAAYVD